MKLQQSQVKAVTVTFSYVSFVVSRLLLLVKAVFPFGLERERGRGERGERG